MSVPTNLIPTRVTQLPEYTGSSTLGYVPYVLGGVTYKVLFANIAAVGAVPSTRVIASGTGLSGGGDLSENRTIFITPGGVDYTELALSGVAAGTYGSGANVPVLTVDDKGRVTGATTASLTVTGFVPTSRTVATGSGLLGGGSLSSNLTLSANYYALTPESLGTASAGASNAIARGDHVHPAVDLSSASQTQGALPLGRGGTGDALSPAAGAVAYSTGTKFALSSIGTSGQVLVSNGTGAPGWLTLTGTGTVNSIDVSGGTTGLTTSGGPITSAGTITIAGTLAVASGGTGATTAATARTALGATAVGDAVFVAVDALAARTAIGAGTSSTTGTVTSVGGTGTVNGITLTGTVTTSGSLTLGGTLSGVSLTTQVAGTLPIANGGTGASDAATARANLGAGTGNGTVTSVGGTGTVSGLSLTGTVTSSGSLTLGGTLSGVSLTTQVSNTLPVANGGTNGTATPTAGAVAYGTGTAYSFTTAGTAGQVLVSTGGTAPAFGGIDGGTF